MGCCGGEGSSIISLITRSAGTVLECHPEDFQSRLPVPDGIQNDGLPELWRRPWSPGQLGEEVAGDDYKLLRHLDDVVPQDPRGQPAEQLVDVLVGVALAQEGNFRGCHLLGADQERKVPEHHVVLVVLTGIVELDEGGHYTVARLAASTW